MTEKQREAAINVWSRMTPEQRETRKQQIRVGMFAKSLKIKQRYWKPPAELRPMYEKLRRNVGAREARVMLEDYMKKNTVRVE